MAEKVVMWCLQSAKIDKIGCSAHHLALDSGELSRNRWPFWVIFAVMPSVPGAIGWQAKLAALTNILGIFCIYCRGTGCGSQPDTPDWSDYLCWKRQAELSTTLISLSRRVKSFFKGDRRLHQLLNTEDKWPFLGVWISNASQWLLLYWSVWCVFREVSWNKCLKENPQLFNCNKTVIRISALKL